MNKNIPIKSPFFMSSYFAWRSLFQKIIDNKIAANVNLIAKIKLGLNVLEDCLTTVKELPQRIATINNANLASKFAFFLSIFSSSYLISDILSQFSCDL